MYIHVPALERTFAIGSKKGNCVGESVHPLLVVCASESLVALFFATRTYQERKTCGGLVHDLDYFVSFTHSFQPRTNVWGFCFLIMEITYPLEPVALLRGQRLKQPVAYTEAKAQATCSHAKCSIKTMAQGACTAIWQSMS